jgi:hypothetical protein
LLFCRWRCKFPRGKESQLSAACTKPGLQQAQYVGGYFMMTTRNIRVLFPILFALTGCKSEIKVDEKDKIFHAGPVQSGFGVIYWGLYKDNKYQFCDGNFMDYGCYTGLYSISEDTVTLHGLKKHAGIPTNRFIIRRYSDMDSSYWAFKYPESKTNWRTLRHIDSLIGSTGDVLPLDKNNRIQLEKDNYFLIRHDSVENNL